MLTEDEIFIAKMHLHIWNFPLFFFFLFAFLPSFNNSVFADMHTSLWPDITLDGNIYHSPKPHAYIGQAVSDLYKPWC